MNQLEGGITVDEGYRTVEAGGDPDSSGRNRSFDPAEHTDESLDVEPYSPELWYAPGFGSSHKDCGNYRIEGVCGKCGEPAFAPHQCGRRGCDNCWGIWAKKTALNRTVRLQSVRYSSEFKQAAHAVVSLDKDIQTVQAYLDGRSRAAEIAKEKGFTAFDVVAHPTRTTDEADMLFESQCGEDDPRGKHVWLREEYTERYHFGLPNSLVEWSPHYHIIGLTSRDMEPAYESDPYTYKFIDSFSRFDLHDKESYEDVYGTYRYLLSHVGLHEDRQFQAVVGYGGLSNTTYAEYKPGQKIVDQITRVAERVAERLLDENEESARAGSEETELGECSECEEGTIINVFRLNSFVDKYGENIPDHIRLRMIVAYEWRTGETGAPAGMRKATTENQAQEAFEKMVENQAEYRL